MTVCILNECIYFKHMLHENNIFGKALAFFKKKNHFFAKILGFYLIVIIWSKIPLYHMYAKLYTRSGDELFVDYPASTRFTSLHRRKSLTNIFLLSLFLITGIRHDLETLTFDLKP